MNECEKFQLRLINLWRLDSKRIEIWKNGALERKQVLWEYKIQGKGLRIKVHRDARRKFLLDGTFYEIHIILWSHPASKAFASLAWCWHTRARLCINRVTKIGWACMDTVRTHAGLIAVHFKQWAHQSVMTIGLSIWNGHSKSEYQFDKRKQNHSLQSWFFQK